MALGGKVWWGVGCGGVVGWCGGVVYNSILFIFTFSSTVLHVNVLTKQPQPHSRGMSQAKHNEKTCTTSTAYYVSVFSGGAWWCGVWSAVCGAGGGVAWEGVGRGGARRGGVR